jgi:hypothetical protein
VAVGVANKRGVSVAVIVAVMVAVMVTVLGSVAVGVSGRVGGLAEGPKGAAWEAMGGGVSGSSSERALAGIIPIASEKIARMSSARLPKMMRDDMSMSVAQWRTETKLARGMNQYG